MSFNVELTITPKSADNVRAISMVREFIKQPGLDWIVEVLVIEDDDIYPVSVFGVPDQAAAVHEAISSFGYCDPSELQIVNVICLDEDDPST